MENRNSTNTTYRITVTLAFCARKKRRILLGKKPQEVYLDALNDCCTEMAVVLTGHYEDIYYAAVSLRCPANLSFSAIAGAIRRKTSLALRQTIPEFSNMQTVWLKEFWIEEGEISENSIRRIREWAQSKASR